MLWQSEKLNIIIFPFHCNLWLFVFYISLTRNRRNQYGGYRQSKTEPSTGAEKKEPNNINRKSTKGKSVSYLFTTVYYPWRFTPLKSSFVYLVGGTGAPRIINRLRSRHETLEGRDENRLTIEILYRRVTSLRSSRSPHPKITENLFQARRNGNNVEVENGTRRIGRRKVVWHQGTTVVWQNCKNMYIKTDV